VNNPHRRTLLAVQQSAEHTTFELQSGENSCTGSENAGTKCIGCSHLAGGEKGVVQQHIVMPTPAIQYRNIGPNQTAQNRNSSSSNGAVRVGDTVALEAPASLLLTLSSVIYLAPVILMLFFAVSCGFLYPFVPGFRGCRCGIGRHWPERWVRGDCPD